MKAIAYSEYGPPEVLHIREMEKPSPKDGEILIRVHATSVNFGDITARNFGNISSSQFNMPGFLLFPARLSFGLRKPKRQVLGSELSGVVEAVGKDVKKFKPGAEIFALLGMEMGAYAEYLCLPENKVIALKPSNLSHAEAAALPYGGAMAIGLLRKANIQPGQKVLIIGASGSIGAVALQLAKYYGAEVTAVCSTPGMDYVRTLGADHVIDYTREDFTQNGRQYDLIFDVLGRSSFNRCKSSLTPKGRLVYVSFKMKQLLQMGWTALSRGRKVICAMTVENTADLEQVRSLAETGKLKVILDQTFPPEQAAAAHRLVENGGRKGSVVITF
ncbi:MAG: NAD(P)-dependent alcohol dehydrogenase [Lewinellaceae bacterium]|nr:NAD(P)-dependent alcohol dehydrogenase [Lewinellaceae bacterium]